MRKREFKNIEWSVVIIAIILCIIGLVALFSATQETEHDEFNKQCIWLAVSLVIMIIVMLIDYETMAKVAPIIYGIFILLLIGVLFTTPVNGATSWFNIGFFSFQPGEFAKVFVILFLALAITRIKQKGNKEINKISKLAIVFAIVGVPILLIIKQPDYGTAAAFLVATALMLVAAGIDKRYIISIILLMIVSVPLLYNFVNCSQAQKLASKMSTSSNKTSSLLFGIQWDLACKFLEENSNLDQIDIKTDSYKWGNYANTEFKITSTNAKQYISSWQTIENFKKEKMSLLSTGASEYTRILNIYDFAGNEWEWTLAHATIEAPNSDRGGSYRNNSEDCPVSHFSHYNKGCIEIGFRVTFY